MDNKYQRENDSPDKVEITRKKVEQLKDQVGESITLVIERGEKLSVLQEKSERLQESGRMFVRDSRSLRRRMCQESYMWYAGFACGVGIVIVVIALSIWGATKH
jgi:vesicle-associated membrane protein 7